MTTVQLPILEIDVLHLPVGLAYHRKKPIQAREIIGSVFDPNAHVSENILTVSELLAPLACEDVQTVRCLGLNYIDHAVGHPRISTQCS